MVEGRPASVSGGRVYVRASEPSSATQRGELASRSFIDGNAPTNDQSETWDISGDGRYVAFNGGGQLVSGANGGVFVRDLINASTERASEAFGGGDPNATCYWSVMARNGRYVVFRTSATNLLSTPDPSFHEDLYIRDLQT